MSTEKPAADKEPPKVLAKYSDEQKRTLERIGGCSTIGTHMNLLASHRD
jgi:hypothetical protein